MIGPDYTFKTFEATVHYEELKKIETFTKGTADSLGVAVEITCAMQYFLRPEDLKDLHQQYDLYYKYGFIDFFLATHERSKGGSGAKMKTESETRERREKM